MTTPGSVYEAIGGMPIPQDCFGLYAQVPTMTFWGNVPRDDMAGAEERLAWFLSQYWGGPPLFNENRGAPRMRLRHAKFSIDMAAHDRWLELMKNSLDQIDEETLPQAYRQMIWQHMNQLAGMLINKAP